MESLNQKGEFSLEYRGQVADVLLKHEKEDPGLLSFLGLSTEKVERDIRDGNEMGIHYIRVFGGRLMDNSSDGAQEQSNEADPETMEHGLPPLPLDFIGKLFRNDPKFALDVLADWEFQTRLREGRSLNVGEDVMRELSSRPAGGEPRAAIPLEFLPDEMRKDPEHWGRVLQTACAMAVEMEMKTRQNEGEGCCGDCTCGEVKRPPSRLEKWLERVFMKKNPQEG